MSFLRPMSFGIAPLMVLLAVFVACGGGSADGPNENTSSSFGRSDPASGVRGPKAPSFSVSTGGGSTFSLDEHGDEVVILYFSFAG